MARACGLTHYHSAIACKHGHSGLRLVSTQQCVECLRLRKLAQTDQERVRLMRRGNHLRRFAGNLGKTRYTSKVPCKRGHEGVRLVSTRQCVECLALRKTGGVLSEESRERLRRRSNAKRRSRQGRVKQRTYYRDVLSDRLDFRLTAFMRACLRRAWVSKNEVRTFEILGFTWAELKAHLEGMFSDGMNWENYGEWHIDHVRPIRLFLEEGETDPKVVNALSNLQPLWKLDNLSKGSKVLS